MKKVGVITHGASRTPEYNIWRGILKRCLSATYRLYPRYGGRGITVCERWLRFENFISDMGMRSNPDLSIERRDNDGPYSPENCYWATSFEQNNNTSNCRMLEIDGRTQSASQWAREFGIKSNTFRARLDRGWSVEDALKIKTGAIENIRNGGYKLLKKNEK